MGVINYPDSSAALQGLGGPESKGAKPLESAVL